MSLSVFNREHLSAAEVKVIADCNFATELLALQMDAEGGPKFVKISREQLTCWQQFLKFFGLGNFANIEFDLKKVAAHCNQYQWDAVKPILPTNSIYHAHNIATGVSDTAQMYKAYVKVCALANKALYHRKDGALYANVSFDTIEKKVEFAQYRGRSLLNRHSFLASLKWNPALRVCDVKKVLQRQFPNSLVRVEDEKRQIIHHTTNLSLDSLRKVNLYVEQNLYDECL